MKDLCIAIDIGNTMTHIGLVDRSALRCLSRTQFPTAGAEAAIAAACAEMAVPKSVPVRVSSVVSSLTVRLEKLLPEHNLVILTGETQLPFRVDYDSLATLGADRLADALYCFRAYPAKTAIIIDAGTAVTIDVLDQGATFCGGAILPGLMTQIRSLFSNTADLPDLAMDGGFVLPGRSTADCIRGGVCVGLTGAIEKIVETYTQRFGQECVVVVTGGDWKWLKPYSELAVAHVADMTIIGTGLL